MHIRPLEPKYAGMVADLEVALMPLKQREGFYRIKEMILVNKWLNTRMALGLFDDSRLVGYYLAYPLGFNRKVRSKHEKMIFISDFAVLPAYRHYVNNVLTSALLNSRIDFPCRPLITEATEYYKNKWIRREPFIRENGYAFAGCDPFRNPGFNEDLFRLRFEPVGAPVHAARDRHALRVPPHVVFVLSKSYRFITKRIGKRANV